MKKSFKITNEKNLKITASVGIISPATNLNLFYIVRNKRGWDIPGGHIKSGETAREAFIREFKEEVMATPKSVKYLATLKSMSMPGTGINVYFGICCNEQFKKSSEILSLRLLNKKKAIENYYGDKQLLADLFKLCKTVNKD